MEIKSNNRYEKYPLLWACYENSIDVVHLLLDKNEIILDLNENDECERYPLLGACLNNNIEIVRLLIDYANKII